MLKRFGRRFYSAKYIYSIQLHSVQPWFLHDKPAKVAWKRGSKKHKQGATQTHAPQRVPGAQRVNEGRLEIEEAFELGVTLYAESNKTKKTGPYGVKDLKLVIMEVDDDGSIYSILGALTISLNEYSGLTDHKIHVPVECDAEIIEAVGQPYFEITVRSWYRQSSSRTSNSSGVSSIGWSAAGASDSDGEHDDMMTTGDSHLDPVKPLDIVDTTKSSNSPMSVVHEAAEIAKPVEEMEKLNEIDAETRKVTTDEARIGSDVSVGVAKSADGVWVSTTETAKNNADSEEMAERDDRDGDLESPPAALAEKQTTVAAIAIPEEPPFVSLRPKYKRLSTINSEDGDQAVELEDEDREDELHKFLESEKQKDELEGLSGTIEAVTEDLEAEPSTPPKATEPKAPETAPEEATVMPMPIPISKVEPVKPAPEIEARASEVAEIKPMPVSVMAEGTSKGVSNPTVAEKNKEMPIEAEPTAGQRAEPRPQEKRARRGRWSCLPGSGLVCCQPALPREP